MMASLLETSFLNDDWHTSTRLDVVLLRTFFGGIVSQQGLEKRDNGHRLAGDIDCDVGPATSLI